MSDYSIGVDLGGTNLRAAAVSRDGRLLEKIAASTHASRGPDAVAEDIVEAVRSLQDRRGSAGLAGVGIGSAGFMDMEKGIIRDSPNLPLFSDYPLRDKVARQLDTPVILENDANAAALGEFWMGAGRDYRDLMMFTLGTGIGGGIILNGKVWHGFVGMGAEVGHMTVVPSGNPCGCGNQGCLEKHASATAVVAMARMVGLGEMTAEEVCEQAEAGDARAVQIFETMGRALGIALASCASLLNLPLYVYAGGMLPAWDFFAPAMLEEARRRSYVFRNTDTRVERAELGTDAGLYGAAYLPFLNGSPGA